MAAVCENEHVTRELICELAGYQQNDGSRQGKSPMWLYVLKRLVRKGPMNDEDGGNGVGRRIYQSIDFWQTRVKYDQKKMYKWATYSEEAVRVMAKFAPDSEVQIISACDWCERRESEHINLSSCGKCLKAKYCSRECQTLHWKKGGHKAECAKLS
uniref:MYND-type domain-containing protein n=1 Tax=Fibrocapsa japonica TaxID=94617 RepID=A0A7S2XZA8_9STRA|mmetsp:Transcript_15269/g.22458  ORF Transcript_15269/g.22458 Transcript_15269/m.22458 type:complete len:156 (+) Transcript_15269:2-469(+)